MILFKAAKTGYDVFYIVKDEKQFLGNINKSELKGLVKYYKDFGNEVEVHG